MNNLVAAAKISGFESGARVMLLNRSNWQRAIGFGILKSVFEKGCCSDIDLGKPKDPEVIGNHNPDFPYAKKR